MNKWKEVIDFLKGKGMNQAGIASECKCEQSTILRLASGERKDVMYSVGNRLMCIAMRLGYRGNDDTRL